LADCANLLKQGPPGAVGSPWGATTTTSTVNARNVTAWRVKCGRTVEKSMRANEKVHKKL